MIWSASTKSCPVHSGLGLQEVSCLGYHVEGGIGTISEALDDALWALCGPQTLKVSFKCARSQAAVSEALRLIHFLLTVALGDRG